MQTTGGIVLGFAFVLSLMVAAATSPLARARQAEPEVVRFSDLPLPPPVPGVAAGLPGRA